MYKTAVSLVSLCNNSLCSVYWITLYNPERHLLDFENFSGHGMISGLCLLDLGISARPWRLRHAAHPVMFGAVFGVIIIITRPGVGKVKPKGWFKNFL